MSCRRWQGARKALSQTVRNADVSSLSNAEAVAATAKFQAEALIRSFNS